MPTRTGNRMSIDTRFRPALRKAVAVFALLACSGAAIAQQQKKGSQQTRSVQGVVHAPDGAPQAGAVVQLDRFLHRPLAKRPLAHHIPALRVENCRCRKFSRAIRSPVHQHHDRRIRQELCRIGGKRLGGELLPLQCSQGPLLEKEVSQPDSLLGIVAGRVAQIEEQLAVLAGALDLGRNLVDTGSGQHAGLEVKNA